MPESLGPCSLMRKICSTASALSSLQDEASMATSTFSRWPIWPLQVIDFASSTRSGRLQCFLVRITSRSRSLGAMVSRFL